MSYRNWIFTFYYPTNEIEENIQKINAEKCKYIIYGHELTKDGKPHLQGYIELNKCSRDIGIKKLLDPIYGKHSPVHVEVANKGRSTQKEYCSKGLQSKEEYDTLGINGPNYGKDAKIYERTFKEFRKGQGKRNDWTDIYNKIKESPNFADILEEFPEYAIKYPNGIQKAIDTVKNSNNLENLKESLSDLKLYNWEVRLENELKEKPDNRKIIWYVDKIGGGGKTTFAKYLLAQGNCTYFNNAKCADIARAYNGERIVIFDFTRSNEGRVNYSAVEQIKNGLIFSNKYDSCHKINTIPHVICMSNNHPDESALSADRWDIRYLNDIDKQVHLPSVPDSMIIETSSDNDSYENDEIYDNILISSEDEEMLRTFDNYPTVDETFDFNIEKGNFDIYSSSSDCEINEQASGLDNFPNGKLSISHKDINSQSLDLGNTDPTDEPRSRKITPNIPIPGALKSPHNPKDLIYEDTISKRQFDAEIEEKYKDIYLDI